MSAVPGAGCKKETSDRDLVLIDATDAEQLLAGEKRLFGSRTAVLVDPRGQKAFEEGHIPGAVNLPFQLVSVEQHRLRGYDTVIVYGKDYRDERADGMSKRLLELGFSDVRTLRGGIRVWVAAGNELETGAE